MAYPRVRRRSSNASFDSELAPPRPSFLASAGHRSSSSSLDSLEPASGSASDSEREGVTVTRTKKPPPPPSSFAFPFQAYSGNPDPGLPIPGGRRRASLDSHPDPPPPPSVPRKQSSSHDGHSTFKKPNPAFMADPNANGESTSSGDSLPRSPSSNSLYRQSAGAFTAGVGGGGDPFATPTLQAQSPTAATGASIPRNSSVHSFRASHLAPSSRPGSGFWLPPSPALQSQYANAYGPAQYATLRDVSTPTGSSTALPLSSGVGVGFPGTPSSANMLLKSKPPPLPSTRLAEKLSKQDKPWLSPSYQRMTRSRSSYCITLLFIILGIVGAAAIVLFGWNEVHLIDESRLCEVMNEQFTGDTLDEGTWNYDVQLGGFGNGEFQMTTKDGDNVALVNNELWITPTLTSDKVDNIFDGGNFTLGDDCTTTNKTACSATSDASKGKVINPIMSARINTQGKKSIRYGKVEARVKLPKGDWLWPALWLLPDRPDVYGTWPISGEIDIVEARGNDPSRYSYQGNDFVRSTLNFGPLPGVFEMIFGWWQRKRGVKGDGGWGAGWHKFVLEWDERVIRVYVDNRAQRLLEIDLGPKSLPFLKGKKKTMWDLGHFPETALNGTDVPVVVQNPYTPRTVTLKADLNDVNGTDTVDVQAGADMAPFDQKFYVVVNLAVGGTSGWFPDGIGGKMWYDGSSTAMTDFAHAQDEWYSTWPRERADRSLRVDYIKMWEMCR